MKRPQVVSDLARRQSDAPGWAATNLQSRNIRPSQLADIGGEALSGFGFGGICELLCDRLPEPAKSICKAAC